MKRRRAKGLSQGLTYVFCLGATKAGTSWLHDQLAAHPEARLSTIKEYHYFTKTSAADFDAALVASTREIDRLTEKNATRPPQQSVWAKAHIADLQDYATLLAQRRQSADGFRALLAAAPGPGHLVGDFTPAYALLPVQTLRQIAGFAPDTRAVYLIRDPVARLWSHVRMVAARAANSEMADAAWGLLRKITTGETRGEAKAIVARGDYARIIPKLARAFDPSRLLVMFYEELMTRPGFARLCAFLGIADHPADFARKVHAGKPLGLTQDDRRSAARFLRPQYEFAATLFPALPDNWRLAMNEA